LQTELLHLVDEDTYAFNKIIDAVRMPKSNEQEKSLRDKTLIEATKYAIEVPFKVMQKSLESMEILKAMAEIGNPNSVSDAGVGALCARTAVKGAFLNVKINTSDLKDKDYVDNKLKAGKQIESKAEQLEEEILAIVNEKI